MNNWSTIGSKVMHENRCDRVLPAPQARMYPKEVRSSGLHLTANRGFSSGSLHTVVFPIRHYLTLPSCSTLLMVDMLAWTTKGGHSPYAASVPTQRSRSPRSCRWRMNWHCTLFNGKVMKRTVNTLPITWSVRVCVREPPGDKFEKYLYLTQREQRIPLVPFSNSSLGFWLYHTQSG